MDATEIAAIIEGALPNAEVEVTTRTDHPEDDHYEATVISPAFNDTSLVQQHQMVYDALEGHMTKDIHALELRTETPDST